MAMSNLYSKISTKPMKRFQDNVAVKQTNAWMNGERNKDNTEREREKRRKEDGKRMGREGEEGGEREREYAVHILYLIS